MIFINIVPSLLEEILDDEGLVQIDLLEQKKITARIKNIIAVVSP